MVADLLGLEGGEMARRLTNLATQAIGCAKETGTLMNYPNLKRISTRNTLMLPTDQWLVTIQFLTAA